MGHFKYKIVSLVGKKRIPFKVMVKKHWAKERGGGGEAVTAVKCSTLLNIKAVNPWLNHSLMLINLSSMLWIPNFEFISVVY